MTLLFQAKATFNRRLTFYNIFRLQAEKYKAEIVLKENTGNKTTVPGELVLIKNNGTWQTEDNSHTELSTVLGAEIDVFNYGYGDLLGRIGVR